MFTLAGFGEDIDAAGATVNIAALADAHLFAQGDNLRVPELSQLIGVFAGIGSGGDGFVRLDSPSLRRTNRLRVSPLNHLADSDAEPSDPPAVVDMHINPRELDFDELLQVFIDSDTSAAAFQWAFVLFGDGVQAQPSGPITTVRATSSTAAVARVWSTVSLSFTDTLPTGRYQAVGLRGVSASGIAARYVFKPGTWRPGCIMSDTQITIDNPLFRNGTLGVWGEFESTTPPDIEVLCDLADSTQVFDLDLIGPL